jgi:hypothetical protein
MKRIICVVGLAVTIAALPAHAQVGVAAHVGTMGLGADVRFRSPRGFRSGVEPTLCRTHRSSQLTT